MNRIKKVFLISNSRIFDSYTEAYTELLDDCSEFKILFFKNRNLLGRIFFNLKVLILPYNSTVIIENISFGMEALILRQDINVIHVPRGGGTFKIGWKTSNSLTYLVKLRLARRNKILVSSNLFSEYLTNQENTALEKFIVCSEPVNILKTSMPRTDTLIALSECATEERYNNIMALISDKKNLKISYHPILQKDSDNYQLKNVAQIITDCTTLCNYGFAHNLDVRIVKEYQSVERRLFAQQEEFFCNITELGTAASMPKYRLTQSTPDIFLKEILGKAYVIKKY